MKKLLSILCMTITFISCGKPDMENMPSMGSGARTWEQAAQITFQSGVYWIGAIFGLACLIVLPILGIIKYNGLKVNDKIDKWDFMIPLGAIVAGIVIFWVLCIVPIDARHYY